jgi:delta14-sterol reductase
LQNIGIATLMFGGFVVALFLGSKFLPGSWHDGAPLPDGTRIKYKLNGLLLYLLLAAVLAVGQGLHWFSLRVVIERFWSLLLVANVFAFGLTAVLYVKGRAGGAPLERGLLGVVKDAFMGTEVNPTFWGVDLKMFAYRPSLMGLGVLNWSLAAVQYEALGHLTLRMWLYQAFYFVYLTNYYQFEYGMLYTWDIIAEKFGWMLVWGDYVLVPFFYSICGWYLLNNLDPLPPVLAGGLPLLFVAGFWLFRGSNEQKHRYKENPKAIIWGKPAETVGGRLLVSGFWGIGRKLNYTGELMVYFSWTLTTGFDSIVPYLLPLWLACLFPHRAWRDEQRCRAKYGAIWDEYCRRAKFRMIPFLY